MAQGVSSSIHFIVAEILSEWFIFGDKVEKLKIATFIMIKWCFPKDFEGNWHKKMKLHYMDKNTYLLNIYLYKTTVTVAVVHYDSCYYMFFVCLFVFFYYAPWNRLV